LFVTLNQAPPTFFHKWPSKFESWLSRPDTHAVQCNTVTANKTQTQPTFINTQRQTKKINHSYLPQLGSKHLLVRFMKIYCTL